ncbi:MAG: HPr kinase/phosphatase C-terminal domain-containing protein [Pseudomonadota bacterium]
MTLSPTIHASAVLVGARAVLIRGPSGSGKSRLAMRLIQAADQGLLRFARLVADDRCHLEVAHGRLLVRPAEALKGMIEVHGLGLRGLPYEPVALVSTVIDVGLISTHRLPLASEEWADLEGLRLPRLAVAAGQEPLPLVLAYLRTRAIPT